MSWATGTLLTPSRLRYSVFRSHETWDAETETLDGVPFTLTEDVEGSASRNASRGSSTGIFSLLGFKAAQYSEMYVVP